MNGALQGVFYNVRTPMACQFVLGVCFDRYAVTDACGNELGLECQTTRLSWQGPAGQGSDSSFYVVGDQPAGAYDFHVDLKLDAYRPEAYEPVSGTYVALKEDRTVLTVADVALP